MAIVLAAVACSASAPRLASQASEPVEARSSQYAMLLGLRTGMTRDEAEQTLTAQGFAKDHNGGFWRVLDGGQEYIILRFFERRARPTLFSLSYRFGWNIFERDILTEEARQQELRRLFAEPPTFWLRDQARSTPIDRFFFASSLEGGTRQRDRLVQGCFGAWQCVSVRDNVDCRPIVANAREFLIEGEFETPGMLRIEITDHDALADDLFADPAFLSRDLPLEGCIPLPIH